MISLLVRRNKNCVNFFNYQRKLSSEGPGDQNEEISECSTTDNNNYRDKSGLLKQHRNLLHNKTPYTNPHSWVHLTEKYQRKIFGRYGSESGIDPRICFRTESDKIAQAPYEKLLEPEMLHSMISKFKAEKQLKLDLIAKREEEIHQKMLKVNQWVHDLNLRRKKKEADAIAAKEKKDRLIEEVRRHFGFKIDPKDERFKELLEQKEKEIKKKLKLEKRQAKERKLIAKLIETPTKTELEGSTKD